MCGIYGMVAPRGAALRHPELLYRMGETLRHRGPDGTGTMALPHAAIGVNRLRIIDLHSRADQPFTDADHCVSLALNGEIYNAADLRRQFPRYHFRSNSDAEVVLPLYLERGAAGMGELEGMFAIAIWDESAHRLVLARDRAGEKPLFYAVVGEEICFASEVQALLQHPEVSRDLDNEGLQDFITFGYVREPRTMFASIRKVEAGTVLLITDRGSSVNILTLPPIPLNGTEAHDDPGVRLDALLQNAVRKQLVSDVPVGVFLSGGLDSSLISAIAAKQTGSGALKTFAVRFPGPSYDEGSAAQAVARHLETDHVEVMADNEALCAAWEEVFGKVAEPVADPAILPTYLLAKRAREEVGVVLSGEGADELFGGYPTYLGHKLAPWMRWLSPVARLIPSSPHSVSVPFLLRRFLSHVQEPWRERHVAWFATGLRDLRPAGPPARRPADVLSEAMHFDYATYLRDGLLPKIDRATMLVSLEARAPYLDRDVTAFAFALPSKLKVRRLTTKWLLKRVARRWLPPSVIGRRKHGLSVPISGLINGALGHEVGRLLSRERLQEQGLLNPNVVGQLLTEHRRGNFHQARGVWALFALQRWLEEWT
jgi:asparagine synthase (glutamine-hydrolysing)